MALALVKPWRTQPYGAAPAINWQSGLTKDLALLNYGFSDNDLVTGGDWVWTAGTNPVATRYGMGRRLVAASTQWGYYDTAFSFDVQNFSMLSICIPQSSSGTQALCGVADSTGNSRITLAYGQVASTFNVLSASATGPSTTRPVNVPQVLVVLRGRGLTGMYVSGTAYYASLGNPPAATVNKATIAGRISASVPGAYLSGIILFTAFWRRGLTDAEARSLSVNPWQLFKGQEQSIQTYYPVLSNAQAVNITNNTATPKVTVTY